MKRTESSGKNDVMKVSELRRQKINNYMSVKNINRREIEVKDLPSDISDDEWGEIQKFSTILHE